MSAREAGAALASRGPEPPRVGVVLGSGLGAVADAVEDAVVVGYDELAGFPRPGVEGHAGRAVLGRLSGVPVAVLQGRAHLYEGDADAVRTPVRALRAAGAETLVLTNAAGSLHRTMGPGSLMAITDHINLTGLNPLVGPNDDAIGPRFPSLSDTYDPGLRAELATAAAEQGVTLHEGVYIGVDRPELRDTRRDPRLRDARSRRRGHVDRPRGDRRAALRPARRGGLDDHEPGRGPVRRAPLA